MNYHLQEYLLMYNVNGDMPYDLTYLSPLKLLLQLSIIQITWLPQLKLCMSSSNNYSPGTSGMPPVIAPATQ